MRLSEIFVGFFCTRAVTVNHEVRCGVTVTQQQLTHFFLNLFAAAGLSFSHEIAFALPGRSYRRCSCTMHPLSRSASLSRPVNQLAIEVDTFAVKNLELSLFEWRGDFVFTTLTRVSLPMTLSPSLPHRYDGYRDAQRRRISARYHRWWFPGYRTSRQFSYESG